MKSVYNIIKLKFIGLSFWMREREKKMDTDDMHYYIYLPLEK